MRADDKSPINCGASIDTQSPRGTQPWKMDALQYKVDSISSEVGQISDVLRGYLEQGIALDRKVQPPKIKAGRDLLQHVLGRLDQVSTKLIEVRNDPAAHTSPSPPTVHRPDTPLSSEAGPVSQLTQTPPVPAQVEHQKPQIDSAPSNGDSAIPAPAELKPLAVLSPPISTASTAIQDRPIPYQASYVITLKDGSVYKGPTPSLHASPLFDCTYQDIRILNEELFELYSSHPVVRDVGYFKLQVRDLPPLNVRKVARPSKDHATSFSYKADRLGLVKVDTGKRFKFSSPSLPLPMSAKMEWSLAEQKDLWNSSAANPPKGTWPYIIGNPLFDDVELSPGEKLRRRGRTRLEGVNTQYVYFNLTGKTITTMHREDAHVRSENLLRSGQHKFWCFVKPAFSKKLEERMALEYPEMRRCSQAVRHLSRHIPPAKLDEWGIEYTLDYCVPGQAVVTEPGTYHQVLNLGPNYAIAINVEYESSPDMPLDYRFCDRLCPDKFAMTADDFRIYPKPPQSVEEQLPCTPETTGSQQGDATVDAPQDVARTQPAPAASQVTQPATPPPEQDAMDKQEPAKSQPHIPEPSPAKTSIPSPEHGSPSTSEPPAQPGVPQGKLNSAEASAPLKPQLTELRPPTLQPLPGQAEPGATAPIQPPAPSMQVQPVPPIPARPASSIPAQPAPPVLAQPAPPMPAQPGAPMPAQSAPAMQAQPVPPIPARPASSIPAQPAVPIQAQPAPPMQSQNPAPGGFAYSAQIVSQPTPFIHNPAGRCGYIGPRRTELPPLRKTARMINPDREYDEPTPRPLKKQRVEHLPSPVAQTPPIMGAFEHLSTLLRGRETSRKGNLDAKVLCGKPAFDRLARLVSEWRRYTKSTPAVFSGFRLIKSVEETLLGYPELHIFLSRFFIMKVATCVEASMARPGRLTPQNFMDGLLQTLGWDEAKRPKLHDNLREGKCWATICGEYDGLLCLIPLDADCLDLALFKDEVARLHAELDNDFVRRLCAVGAILQKSIWENLELPEFIWESMTTTWLPLDRISPLLALFRLLKSNYYDPTSGFYWPRPAGWTWQWPADPSMTKPGDSACSLCARKSCRCAQRKVPQIPRISDDGSRGPGVRSVGPHRANEILGELVGELVPLGSCAADWTMALHRPDLDDEPVADIYPRRMGNWVRKVNHSTDPSAAFRVMKISGRWRQMLVAARDIGDGEEITAKYGRGYMKKQPYSVVEGLH
jgi:hypothetical protein